jgi:hypothetical protein
MIQHILEPKIKLISRRFIKLYKELFLVMYKLLSSGVFCYFVLYINKINISILLKYLIQLITVLMTTILQSF